MKHQGNSAKANPHPPAILNSLPALNPCFGYSSTSSRSYFSSATLLCSYFSCWWGLQPRWTKSRYIWQHQHKLNWSSAPLAPSFILSRTTEANDEAPTPSPLSSDWSQGYSSRISLEEQEETIQDDDSVGLFLIYPCGLRFFFDDFLYRWT